MLRSRRLLLFLSLSAVTVLLVLAMFLSGTAPVRAQIWPSLPYQSEDQWIVGQTARAVIDLAQFARTATPSPIAQLTVTKMAVDPAQPARLTFRVGSRDVAIDLTTYVWDPDAYVALARAEGAQAAGAEAPADDALAAALLDFKVETFQVQNDAVSIALHKEYRNPANHEAAALVLAAFALREISGNFLRSHVSCSAERPPISLSRAPCAVRSHNFAGRSIGRHHRSGRRWPHRSGDASTRGCTSVHGISAATEAWTRALRYRATLDWRVRPSDEAPPLERLEVHAGARADAGRELESRGTSRRTPWSLFPTGAGGRSICR